LKVIEHKYARMKNLLLLVISIASLLSVSAQDQTLGLMIYDEAESMDGYVFFTPNSSNKAYIIDNKGFVVNEGKLN